MRNTKCRSVNLIIKNERLCHIYRTFFSLVEHSSTEYYWLLSVTESIKMGVLAQFLHCFNNMRMMNITAT